MGRGLGLGLRLGLRLTLALTLAVTPTSFARLSIDTFTLDGAGGWVTSGPSADGTDGLRSVVTTVARAPLPYPYRYPYPYPYPYP